jgi:hypothetical protein
MGDRVRRKHPSFGGQESTGSKILGCVAVARAKSVGKNIIFNAKLFED